MPKDFMSNSGSSTARPTTTNTPTPYTGNSSYHQPTSTQVPTSAPAPKSGATFNAAKDSQLAYDNNGSAAEVVTLAFSPNMLDNYDVYTYHWKLFMVPLKSASSGHVMDPAVQTIIAESGVSDLTIDKVEIQGVTTPCTESGTGTMTNVKFEIVEPSGAGLIDKIFYQSAALGIGSWTVNPYFLQLEFRGRDPYTEETLIGGDPLRSLIWVWPISLGTAKANVTKVGTRYDFEAVIYDEKAQTNSYFALLHNVVLKNLTTFGSAIRDLENKLNADQFEKLIDNYSIPDTYTFVIDPELDKIALVNPDEKKNTSRGADYKDLSKKTAEFHAGTGIDKIVDSLLGSTKDFQQDVQGAKTPTAQPDPANVEKRQMKKLWRVVTETKPIAFDALRQDNAVAITIFIVKYDIGVLDATPDQTAQTPETNSAERKRWNEYVKYKILNKRYNYLFTGLNDQVHEVDLTMNYAFAAAISRFGGVYYDSALSDKGISQQENAEEEKKASEEIRKLLQFINDASPSTNIDSKIAATKKSIENANIDPALKEKYKVILNHAKPAQRKVLTTTAQEQGGMNANGSFNQSLKNAKYASLATAVNGLTFVSDVDVKSSAAINAKLALESLRKGKLRPIPYKEVAQEANFSGIDPASNAGRARTSSMFATALYTGLDGSMQHLKLSIKGDPYWLFPKSMPADTKVLPYRSNMSEKEAIKDIKLAHMTYPDSVNILGTDNFIVFRFRTPRIYNDATGLIDPIDAFTEVETFSGVYKVTRTTSKFEMGKFSQELDCILDPVINLSEFLTAVEEASKKPDPVLPRYVNVPTNAIKTEKITGTAKPTGSTNTIRDPKGNVSAKPNQSPNTSNIPENTFPRKIG